ncbi:MAG: NYN domain-containing protein [Chloroflexota bacterium]
MPYLIDGHNLIPCLGLRLDSSDDEQDLIDCLLAFYRQHPSRIEVYFDGAPAGYATTRRFGEISAHFIRQGSSADVAIKNRLRSIGREARNWTVVSSDHDIQQAARGVQASVISSAEFARQVLQTQKPGQDPNQNDAPLTAAEVEDWLDLFSGDPGEIG